MTYSGGMKGVVDTILRVFLVSVGVLMLAGLVGVSYFAGYVRGFNKASALAGQEFALIKLDFGKLLRERALSPEPTPVEVVSEKPVYQRQEVPGWTGPELWEAVNRKRQEYGVNPLSNKSELCTIASIRLNQLLALGTLDGHEGFGKLPEEREDLRWIFEKYDVSEFLVSGAQTANEAVSLWENTLGHKKLLTGGEYVWGCVYAQAGFGVAITAF